MSTSFDREQMEGKQEELARRLDMCWWGLREIRRMRGGHGRDAVALWCNINSATLMFAAGSSTTNVYSASPASCPARPRRSSHPARAARISSPPACAPAWSRAPWPGAAATGWPTSRAGTTRRGRQERTCNRQCDGRTVIGLMMSLNRRSAFEVGHSPRVEAHLSNLHSRGLTSGRLERRIRCA